MSTKSVQYGRANHRECMGLPCGSMGKRDTEDPPFHRAERTATSGVQSGTAKILQVGQSKVKQTPPDQGSDPEYDPLLETSVSTAL